jgi:hypothetical protein
MQTLQLILGNTLYNVVIKMPFESAVWQSAILPKDFAPKNSSIWRHNFNIRTPCSTLRRIDTLSGERDVKRERTSKLFVPSFQL